jgi:hypothetical protein
MKLLFACLFLGAALLLGANITAATAQTQLDNRTSRVPAPVVVGPFQALGNVIRNPDADPPRRRTAPPAQTPPPTIIPPNTLQNGAITPGTR